jgi:CRP-like cAMP-binding protein
LFAALQADADLAFDFIQLLCGRLRWVSDLLEDRAFLPLPVRLAKRLLFLVDHIGDEGGTVPVSQGDLADFVAATREGVAKTLGIWRRRGWVYLTRGAVTVTDRAALAGVAGALDE